MKRIGLRLDRAVHLAVSRAFVLCVPFVICDAAYRIIDAVTADDWPGYILSLAGGSLFEIWARVWAVCVLRGDPVSQAVGETVRRPGTWLLFAAVSCVELWANPFNTELAWLPASLMASLAVFASLLALAESVSTNASPLRALAFWLREMCRPARLWMNLVGALTVNLLMFGVISVLEALPLPDWPITRALYVIPEALGDTIAMVFAVLWREAVLDERRGRDIELMLDAVQGTVTVSPRPNSPGSITSQ